ncbi:MAG TPA: DUF1343 domain-containing protein [Polyangia bacterium]|jgi:uncharacterized protein YbbC (DUF1343 family)|nr:DUF1343 domain-containing protein [Polyangia bacterium]
MVETGLDVLCAERTALCRGRRVGVLCHPASVASDLTHAVDRLIAAGIRPTRLFGPEHGVRGDAQDMIGVADDRDARTGIPVSSLYGSQFESLTPTAADLATVDVLLIDLQDVGSRYYTYVWTMALTMGAAAKAGVQVVVLDRPNPIGGGDVEGGPLTEGHESFVGLGPVTVRHGLTAGEIATMVRAGMSWAPGRFARPLDVDLTVVPMRGWQRGHDFATTGLPWVMPSPNMPTLDTAFVYPGLCLIEGTNLSEGRGTTRPFEIIGAPFLEGHRWAEALARESLPGVRFRPLSFRPMFHKFAGQSCGGVQLHVTDRAAFRPYRTGIAVLNTARALAPEHFRWRTEPYEFVTHPLAIDLLTGSDVVRRAIDDGRSTAEIAATLTGFEAAFSASRTPFLMYE